VKSAAIVIPIKTNNQRLPGKNTMSLNGRPLYDYVFQTVKKCKSTNDVFVDSSDESILNIATANGFKTIRRPAELNSPSTSGNDLLNFELRHINHDIICQCFVTLPFLKSETIDRSIDFLKASRDKTSVLALYREEDRFWYNDEPVNHGYAKLVGTQYMKPVFREAGFYTFHRGNFIKNRSRVTDDRVVIEVDRKECIDIDTELDFIYAESLTKAGIV